MNVADENDRARTGELSSNPEDGTVPMQPDAAARRAVAKLAPASSDPSDPQAEASLLGMLLWAGAHAAEALPLTSVTDLIPRGEVFFVPAHATIFDAMGSLAEQGKPIDAVSVHSELVQSKKDRAAGGVEYLEQLISLADSCAVARARRYAESIRNAWLLRRLILASDSISNSCRARGANAGTAVVQAVELVRPIGEDVSSDAGVTSLKASVTRVFQSIGKQEKVEYLETGFRDLDLILAGLFPRETTIIAARTSVGKTALATQICTHIVQKYPNAAILYVTLEMSADNFTKRMISTRARIDGHALRTGEALGESEMRRAMQAAMDLSKLNLYFAEKSKQSILSIHAMAKSETMAMQMKGLRLAVIVVDHIGLVQHSGRSTQRHEQVAEISRGLRGLAEQHGCHVLALAQINRNAEGKKMPALSDLKDSGSIEEDADNVIILHREKDENDTFIPNVPAWVNVAKGRNDGTGRFRLKIEPRYLTFSDWNDT